MALFFLFFYYFFILYFNNILKYFILITLFSLFIFILPCLLNCVADRVLVLQLGVRPEPQRWKSRVQDIGSPETSWPHIISVSKTSPRDIRLNVKTQLHSNQQAPVLDTPCQTTSKTGIQPHPLAERLPKIIISPQTPQNTPPDSVLPTRKTRSSLIHQNTGTRPLHHEAYTTH